MKGRDKMATRMAREFERLVQKLENLGADIQQEAKRALQIEGQKIRRDAIKLSPVNTGYLRGSWYTNVIKRTSEGWEKEVGNSSEYASFIEKGFRSHFVPGYWVGNSFAYDRNAGKGMFVGGKQNTFVQGKYMLEKATQPSERRVYNYLNRRIQNLGRDIR